GVTENVNQAGTTTTLTTSANPAAFGQAVTFAAGVTVNPPGSGVPSGSVTFQDGGTPLGTVALTNGLATLTTSSLAAGPHTIAAAYSGDPSFAASASTPLSQTVQAPPTPTPTP